MTARPTKETFPLVAAVHETVLPGERRVLGPPALETRVATRLAVDSTVLVLTVGSVAEVPALVVGRWGTLARVEAATEPPGAVAFVGLQRARIVATKGTEASPRVEIEHDPAASVGASERDVLESLHALFATLRSGAVPAEPTQDALSTVVPVLLRATVPTALLSEYVGVPPREALARVVAQVAARVGGWQGATDLEAIVRRAAGHEEMPAALRAQLWAQVVEIERRLDVYDPSVPYEEGDDAVRLTRKLQQAGLPKAVREVVKSRLKGLKIMRHDGSDYATQVRNLELAARLCWHPAPRPPVSIARVREALDRAHHGLETSKRRVEEWVAVKTLGGEARSTILCLSGPPGTGKTTIARAIAEALGRPFGRVALGGVHDECELRGHRMSCQAAAPGRLIEEIARSDGADPLILLDEIDKLGTDTGRSPAAALMEILDPEQHVAFQDNFLALPYELSRVMFICTANEIERVRGPLRDRLEVIEIEGYSAHEKLPIARAHILPGLARELGLREAPEVDDAVLLALIEGYTRESGVRSLRRTLASLLRDRVHALASTGVCAGDPQPPPLPLTLDDVHRVLGAPRAAPRTVPEHLPVGACLGLSVSADGGAPMILEVGRRAPSRPGGDLMLTGQLGEVMRESVRTVLAHLRLYADRYRIDPAEVVGDWFVHAPEAAVPKDGPSAGVALLMAMISALRNVAVPATVAITGEMSLHGSILPVGGVRAKCLAAERAGLARVLIPRGCEPDVPKGLRCTVVAVDRAEQVVEALWPAAGSAP